MFWATPRDRCRHACVSRLTQEPLLHLDPEWPDWTRGFGRMELLGYWEKRFHRERLRGPTAFLLNFATFSLHPIVNHSCWSFCCCCQRSFVVERQCLAFAASRPWLCRPPPSSLSLAGMPSGSCRIKVVFGGGHIDGKVKPGAIQGVPLLLALSSVRCRFVLAFESLDGGECLFLVVLSALVSNFCAGSSQKLAKKCFHTLSPS